VSIRLLFYDRPPKHGAAVVPNWDSGKMERYVHA
jgi:hypothetical protein